MLTRKLFGEVDYAVGEALATRPSQLDSIDWECWTEELLAQDAAEVKLEMQRVCEAHGWTLDDYSATYNKVRLNRHAPNHLY